MIYFEYDKEYVFLWPSIAISTVGEFWIGLAWLCFEIGWRSGDDGEQDWNEPHIRHTERENHG